MAVISAGNQQSERHSRVFVHLNVRGLFGCVCHCCRIIALCHLGIKSSMSLISRTSWSLTAMWKETPIYVCTCANISTLSDTNFSVSLPIWEVDTGISSGLLTNSDLQTTVDGRYFFISIYVWEDSQGLKLVHMLHQINEKIIQMKMYVKKNQYRYLTLA